MSVQQQVEKGKQRLDELVDKANLLFNKSLSSMVKGIRSHKDKGQAEYIAKSLAAIKKELKSLYPDLKAEAVRKLIYLQMIGYDMAWASFHVVEVMSQPWFGHKRIGYLAAALSFTPETDVILLTTHLFRKAFQQSTSSDSEITAGLQYETGAAISSLANIVTPDLAKDLLSDIYGMMNSSKPYLRKKAVLVLLKIFKQYPNALRLSFDRLKEKLKDENQGVVSAAVYVVCELAARNPKNYLSLAPDFFKILTTSSNNWVLIKVVKLLGSLVPLEPRLAKKLTDPLVEIITTTPAKSLLYECVNTLLCGKLSAKSVVQLCLDKLRTFIEDPDQNLKYLGLLGLHKLMQKQPRVVSEHQDLILDCLKDDDPTIRMRSLDLLTAMVSKRNLTGIVRRLVEHLEISEGSYRDLVLGRILEICSQKNYAYVSNFEWYLENLVALTNISGASRENAEKIREQLMDVVIRVPDVREHGVKLMADLLIEGRLLSEAGNLGNAMSDVLYAAAWIVGEFSPHLKADPVQIITTLVGPEVHNLSLTTQNVFIQNAIKTFAAASHSSMLWTKKAGGDEDEEEEEEEKEEEEKAKEGEEKTDGEQPPPKPKKRKRPRSFQEWCALLEEMLTILKTQLLTFTHSNYVEVQERAVAYSKFVKWFGEQGGFWAYVPDEDLKEKKKKDDDEQSSDEDDEESKKKKKKKQKEKEKREKEEQEKKAKEEEEEKERQKKLAEAKEEPPKPQNVLYLPGMEEDFGGSPSGSSTVVAEKPVEVTTKDEIDLSAPVPGTESTTTTGTAGPVSVDIGVDTPQRRTLLTGLVEQFAVLFGEVLNPVNPKAQKKVPVPVGLDLEAWINEPEEDEEDEDDKDDGYSLETKEEDLETPKKPLTKQEKEEAKERLKKELARKQHDPFYIKDKPKQDINVDDIPEKHLSREDLPDLKMEKKSKKKKVNLLVDDAKIPKKVYTILTNEDLPEGAVESDEEKEDAPKDKNDEDVDITTPLGADEVIAKPQAYGMPKIGGDEKKAGSEKEEKHKKHKKDKSGKKEEKDKSGKKKKKEKHKKEDREKSGKKKKHKKKKEDEEVSEDKTSTPTVSSPPATPTKNKLEGGKAPPKTGSQNVIELFDPIGEDERPAKPEKAAAPAPSAKASAPSAEEKDSTAARSGPTARERTLYQDSTLSVTYVAKANEGTSKYPSSLVLLDFALTSPKAKGLKSIKLRIANPSKAKIGGLKNKQGKLTDKGAEISFKDGKTGEASREVVQLDWTAAFSAPLKVQARLSYKDKKGKGKSKKECELVVPCSTFVIPKKVTPAELTELSKKCTAKVSKRIEIKKPVKDILQQVIPVLQVHLIEAVNFVAQYYGQLSTDGSPVIASVKMTKGDNSGVEATVKTTSDNISEALFEELSQAIQN